MLASEDAPGYFSIQYAKHADFQSSDGHAPHTNNDQRTKRIILLIFAKFVLLWFYALQMAMLCLINNDQLTKRIARNENCSPC